MLQFFLKKDTGKKFNYIITTPDDYDREKETLPLIVFLHGAGDRGDDLNLVKNIGIPMLFQQNQPVRAITFSPQCDSDKVWNTQIYPVKELIDEIVEEYHIDKNRITITGMSMGGYGTWEMALTFPHFFAAIAPICGGGMAWRAELLRHLPIRAFHGDIDDVVDVRNSIEMVDAVNRAGGHAELILYHNIAHWSWVNAYEDSDLVAWLYRHSKEDTNA